jgi:hypothetical protein
MYSLLALSSVLSVYFLLKFLEQQVPRALFNYLWSTTLLVYTHLYGLFIVLAENIYILVVLYRFGSRSPEVSLKKWVTVQGTVFLLCLPWFILLINRILNLGQEGFWVQVPTAESIVRTFAAFSGTSGGLALWILLMVLGALSVLAGKTGFRWKVFNEPSTKYEGWHIFLLLLLVFTPILVPYLISKFTTPIYIIRCTIAGQFAVYLLVAKGITSLRWPFVRFTALILLLAILLRPLLTDGYVHRNAAEFRQVVGYLAAHVTDSDRIILCSQRHLDWPFRYYARRLGLRTDISKAHELANSALQRQNGHLWLVKLSDRASNCHVFQQAVSGSYIKVSQTHGGFRNIELDRYQKRQGNPLLIE